MICVIHGEVGKGKSYRALRIARLLTDCDQVGHTPDVTGMCIYCGEYSRVGG